MTRAIAIVTASVLLGLTVAPAQGQTSPQTLVDVAKAEEARRKSVRKPAKVFTNDSLKPDNSPSRPAPPPVAANASPATTTPSTAVPAVNLAGGSVPQATAETRDQAYWSGRISTVRTAQERSRMFAAALQTRINSLKTDFVNRDDPAQRAQIDADLKSVLAEVERVKKEMETQQKEIAAIEDEARRAGVPSGWLRPGA